ncbi:MAG TPA: 3,4-dihydroxy-2-butanone-4-phosphate synthase [Actinomadura sp.]|jgi:3,4-dihydroxy-2-butanone 4-phosphate synthase|nr:3,4-dihydroxy-2-butanone-4-phosphate synthase [Actinomadura sp.]
MAMPTGDAIRALDVPREGRVVVVVTGDAGRENEADLVLAAERTTPESGAFFRERTDRAHIRHVAIVAGGVR